MLDWICHCNAHQWREVYKNWDENEKKQYISFKKTTGETIYLNHFKWLFENVASLEEKPTQMSGGQKSFHSNMCTHIHLLRHLM